MIVHNLHLRIGFCEIWQIYAIITVKNHGKYEEKTHFFDKNQKLIAENWHQEIDLKFSLYKDAKKHAQCTNIDKRQPLQCSSLYSK